MIFDHVSIQWGRWDNFGITGTSSTVTLQNSIVGEACLRKISAPSLMESRTSPSPTTYGSTTMSATPSSKRTESASTTSSITGELVAALSEATRGRTGTRTTSTTILIAGPSAVAKFFTFYTNTDHAYQTGNMVDVNKDGQLNGRAVVNADFEGTSPPTFETAAHSKPPVPVTVLSAEDAYARVVAQAGTCQHRDAVELRLIGQLSSLGTKGAIIGNESDVGGQPAVTQVTRPAGFDTDGDGNGPMPGKPHTAEPKQCQRRQRRQRRWLHQRREVPERTCRSRLPRWHHHATRNCRRRNSPSGRRRRSSRRRS